MYDIEVGKEGLKLPIYCNGQQVAQIDEGCVVIDRLHHYKIYLADESLLTVATLFCAYLYVTGPYTPGEEMIHSTEKTVAITTNKLLKEKYNPDFIKRIDN